jgi:hypothetical protein
VSTRAKAGGAMIDVGQYKKMVHDEVAALFGSEVNVEFPNSPLGKLSVVTGPEWGKVAKINLVNLSKDPQPVDYMILPNRILISWSRPSGPAEIRDATEGELREAIRQALVSWLVPASFAA